ncbi:uncharacterized protein LOC110700378 isoform X1 [Chenopodium quinoa]|uniref:uncharacterized protein LOC110700378 isoform X1 n=1 Tax=Chenopodium quinoa TaxID=63459 RepID=UPI000B774101|nr:uncharacterized protein LOC110700378 isoform X1 [Chenopodium quinoa]
MERGLISEEVISPEQLGGGFQKSDGGEIGDVLSPVSSQYSSCGESEFDRYCSANSVMGTPSVCSSMGFYHDSLDSDFGSFKSLEGFSLGGERVPRKFEGITRSLLSRESGLGDSLSDNFHESKGEGEGLSPVVGGVEGKMVALDKGGTSSTSCGNMRVLGGEAELKGSKVFDGEVGKKENLAVLLKSVEHALLQGVVAARSAAENLLDDNHADEMEDERCREQDESSSRYDHSEGEDSMFNYGSDEGSQHNAYYVRNVVDRSDVDVGCGNSVLMNSSVAFGSNDWDDFELDGLENTTQLSDSYWLRQQSSEKETTSEDLALMRSISNEKFHWHEEERNSRDVSTDRNDVLEVDRSSECSLSSTTNTHSSKIMEAGATEGSGDISRCKQITSNDELDEYLDNCSVYNVFQKPCATLHAVEDTESMRDEKERKIVDITRDTKSGHDDHPIPQKFLVPLPDDGAGEAYVHGEYRLDVLQGAQVESSEGCVSKSALTWLESEEGRTHGDLNLGGGQTTSSKGKDLEMNAFYDDFVHEMEEILLETSESPVGRLKQGNIEFQSEHLSTLRDGESIAHTSGFDDGNPVIRHPLRIDGIEVVGAKQIKGDIPLSERLVGVKEYTVYIIQVWSGKDQWKVERRYRDFYALYIQLQTLFAARKWNLPPVWFSVDKESRKFFGNTSPNVVAERSTLIQECLCSILQSRYCSSPPSALIWFLSPPEDLMSSSRSNDVTRQSNVRTYTERVPSLGKTISLIVNIQSHKSVKELLDTQHYTCAGCHTHFGDGKNRMLGIVQTFGWGKPRLCEYTGQLFCSSCHTNETAVLPARVLHNWDFTPYPVSQMAKSFLDSIVDKPMLCVSAANPLLFSRVPALLHVVGIRRKVGAMLPYIRCSFRRSIYRRLGYRKYLLESNDFFALRDLNDLSKGAFAALPAILEAVSKKIQEHITELCLECCDLGVSCGARQACDNPSSLIFPFQEEEIQRCESCKSVFHKHCLNKLQECPCGAVLKPLANAGSASGFSSLLVKKSDPKSGLLSRMFSISRQEKGLKDNDNVILMGSFPSTSL